jgi:hypothetical protein
MNKTIKTITRCGVGFSGHLVGCFAAAAVLGALIGDMAGMFAGLGISTTALLACGGYKRPKETAVFVALGLAAIATHHTFSMDHSTHSNPSSIEEMIAASWCFTPK